MGFCPSKENSNSQGTSVISVRPFFVSIPTQHSHIQNQMKPRKGPSGWSDAPRRDRNANMTGAYTTGLGARSHSIKSPPTGPASERTSWDTGQWYKDSQKSGQSDAGPSTSTQAGASATTWGTTPDWAKSPPQWADKSKGNGFASPGWGGAKDSEGTWDSSGGWGSTDKVDSSAGTWGSGWGTSDAGIGLENVPTQEPQPMQVDSSPPSTSKGKEKEIPRRDSQDTIMLPPLPDPSSSSSHIPLPKKRKDSGKQPAPSLTVDVSGSGSGASDQPPSPSHLLTDAQNVYKDVMKYVSFLALALYSYLILIDFSSNWCASKSRNPNTTKNIALGF